MPVQSVNYWEEKARMADVLAQSMGHDAARIAMREIAQLYRKLAEQTRKLKEAELKR